jgi:tetratricopeptide (TPR) repeat protein
MVTAIQRWLREQQDWLLILDNVEDLSLVNWFLPLQHQGAVLLTTRRQVTEPVAQTIAMDVLPEEEGALLLLRRTKSLPLNGSLDKATEVHRQTARSVARTLGGLPLALDQAGAYILETGCDLAAYLVLYKERRTNLLRRRGNVPSDHPLSVTTTFTLAFEEVRRSSEAAIELHRLVQAVLQDALEEAERRSWAERAIYAVNAAFPHVKPNAWPRCERLLTQALAATQVIQRYQLISDEAGRLLYETATYLLERGARYAEAELLYQRALAIWEQQVGVEHPLIATVLNSLAILYCEQGMNAEAEPLLQRALHIRLQALGPEHAETAETMRDLGLLWESQGSSEMARAWYSRALAVHEQILGADHPKTIKTRERFIALLHAMGQYEEAAQFENNQPDEGKVEEERKVRSEE